MMGISGFAGKLRIIKILYSVEQDLLHFA